MLTDLYANGVPLVIEHGTFGDISIYGGGTHDVVSTSLTVGGGVFDGTCIYGGGKGASVNGDVGLTVTGGTFKNWGNIIGGGEQAQKAPANVTGTITLALKGIEGSFNIIQGASTVNGNQNMDIHDIVMDIEGCNLLLRALGHPEGQVPKRLPEEPRTCAELAR